MTRDEPVRGPIDDSVEGPVGEPLKGSVDGSLEGPTDESLEAPAEKSLEGPIQETGPRRLDPRVRSYWWVRGALTTVFLGGGVLAMDLGFAGVRVFPDAWPQGLVSGGILLISALWAALVPPIAYERWRFALRDGDLWIRRGILVRSVSVIPYRRLQFVDTEQGPVARLFGLAELVVHTAAPGTSGRVPGLDASEAETLRERLAHLEPTDDEPI